MIIFKGIKKVAKKKEVMIEGYAASAVKGMFLRSYHQRLCRPQSKKGM
jgi:hypothetical protein